MNVAEEALKFLIEHNCINNVYKDGDRYTISDTGCGCCSGSVEIPKELHDYLESLGA